MIKRLLLIGDDFMDPEFKVLGIRDITYLHWTKILDSAVEYETCCEAFEGNTLRNIQSNIGTLISEYNPSHVIFQGGYHDIINGMGIDTFNNTILKIYDIIEKKNIIAMYLLIPMQLPRTEDESERTLTFYKHTKDLGYALQGKIIIDTCSIWLGNMDMQNSDCFLDNLHFSSYGQSFLVEIILSYLTVYSSSSNHNIVTSAPDNPILVQLLDSKELYIKMNDEYIKLFITEFDDHTVARVPITWRC